MSTVDKKKKIFGNIGAMRTLSEGFPKFPNSSSFPSVNNGGNSITFLTDLIKSLIGFAALVKMLVEMLTHSIEVIEKEIKKALKVQLKEIVSCGVDPSLPQFIKHSGSGIIIPADKVDFLDILKVSPTSESGRLLYSDVDQANLVDSSDFNTFLAGVVEDEGVAHTWKNIFTIRFDAIGSGTRPNNSFTFNATSNYTKLTDLNNDFVDSINLFNTQGILNKIIDILYGSISITTKQTTKQLETEAKINDVIDSFTCADDGDVIDDSYFTFTNEQISQQQASSDLRKKGIKVLEECSAVPASIPVKMLTDFNDQMIAAPTTQASKAVISNSLNEMAEENTKNSPNPADSDVIKINFIQGIINTITKTIASTILSPKVSLIFIVNFKIIYGENETFDGPIDFMKKNKNLFLNVIKKISGEIIKILLAIALKKIAELVAAAAAKKLAEKGKNRIAQLVSLIGLPQSVLRLIKGLG